MTRRIGRSASEGPTNSGSTPVSRQSSSEVTRKKSSAMFFLPQNNESPGSVMLFLP